MFLTSLANSLPRLASIPAFLCLVVAHLEWPLTDSPHYRRRHGRRADLTAERGPRAPTPRRERAPGGLRSARGGSWWPPAGPDGRRRSYRRPGPPRPGRAPRRQGPPPPPRARG